MSFFTGNKEALQKAVTFFNKLNSERQAYLISNIAKTNVQFEQSETDNFMPIFEAIRNDMSGHNNATMINESIDLGMDRTYPALLVDNVIKETPAIEYEIKVLSKISDDEFQTKMPELTKMVWVENTGSETVSDKLGFTSEQNNAMANVFRTTMTAYLRSDSSIQSIGKN